MKNANNDGIETILDEIRKDIENNKLEKAVSRLYWLLSIAATTNDKDLFLVEGILRKNIRRFENIPDMLNSLVKKGTTEKKDAEDLLKRAIDSLIDMVSLSKDYLLIGDRIKFFDSIAQDCYTIQEISEVLRLEEE